MKPLLILIYIVSLSLLTTVSVAQQSYLGGGAIISTALSEKTNPRLGIFWQFERTLNPQNSIIINSGQPQFKSKIYGLMAVSDIKAGWRYLFKPGKVYAGLNAGIAIESSLARWYGNDLRVHPMLEINSGYLIPFKNDRIDIGISYDIFFYKYQNFSWLQLNMGYHFLLPHRKKKKD
ncbi:MAG: hypothetical protein HYR66_07205 [Sphingobacteriales bacterium]|nr:hypothetical protein [Sphingobacteriales bacterium]MBI3718164.1 hypothetical protein [Sphingobacteriales bacterium]